MGKAQNSYLHRANRFSDEQVSAIFFTKIKLLGYSKIGIFGLNSEHEL